MFAILKNDPSSINTSYAAEPMSPLGPPPLNPVHVPVGLSGVQAFFTISNLFLHGTARERSKPCKALLLHNKK